MADKQYDFKEVTLLITHYNRSRSLERLLNNFKQMGCSFGDIVVSDDCSKPEHVEYIRSLHNKFNFRLVTTEKNGGLGNNINKGQDAVTTPYTLYVQEDFDPLPGFTEHFPDAMAIMNERKDIDIIRFYAYFKYPYLKPFGKGFSEMIFRSWYPGYYKFYQYSDHPHLRRSNFLQKFGRYVEGQNVDKTEYRMSISFLRKKGKGLFYDAFTTIFDQVNTSTEPSTASYRKEWKNSKKPVVLFLRAVYLQFKFVKFNFDLLFMR